jgi:hypothetical protein
MKSLPSLIVNDSVRFGPANPIHPPKAPLAYIPFRAIISYFFSKISGGFNRINKTRRIALNSIFPFRKFEKSLSNLFHNNDVEYFTRSVRGGGL